MLLDFSPAIDMNSTLRLSYLKIPNKKHDRGENSRFVSLLSRVQLFHPYISNAANCKVHYLSSKCNSELKHVYTDQTFREDVNMKNPLKKSMK